MFCFSLLAVLALHAVWGVALWPLCGICIHSVTHRKQHKLITLLVLGFAL